MAAEKNSQKLKDWSPEGTEETGHGVYNEKCSTEEEIYGMRQSRMWETAELKRQTGVSGCG